MSKRILFPDIDIKRRFTDLQNVEDLSQLINDVALHAAVVLPGRQSLILNSKVLNYYAFQLREGQAYNVFTIPKKDGSDRVICAPNPVLAAIQKCLSIILQEVYKPHKAAHGFIYGRNVLTNARSHIQKGYVLNIDIKDFFPSCTFHKFFFLLKQRPFLLGGDEKRSRIAMVLANLCCYQSTLPQGAPSSPVISNILTRRVDARLYQLAKKRGMRYSRYADDLTFSSNQMIFNNRFIQKIEHILQDDGFKLNDKKTRLNKWYQRQEVTGVVVNVKPNVNREYIKDVRFWIHCWRKFGVKSTQTHFEQCYPSKKGGLKRANVKVDFREYLLGKIEYLKSIRGHDDGLYRKFMGEIEKIDLVGKAITESDYLLEDLKTIKKALELKGEPSEDYSFIEEHHWRKKLISDNLKMEHVAIRWLGENGKISDADEVYLSFCQYLIFQIELLMNIFFTKKYDNVSQLKSDVELLKSKNEIRKDYKVFSYNNTINAIALGTKLDLFFRLQALYNKHGELHKRIKAVKNIRNTKIAHRPAVDEHSSSRPTSLADELYKNKSIEEIRGVFRSFLAIYQREYKKI